MNTSIQISSAIMMALAVASYFWVYKVTSSSVFQPRRGDRRVTVRPEGYDRRSLTENTIWNSVEYWAHRVVWIFVAAASLLILMETFGSGIRLV